MSQTDSTQAALQAALAPHGLRVRGGFAATRADALPVLPGGRAAAVVWLVGHLGSECWSAFSASPMFDDGRPHPMDRWARSVAQPLAERLGGAALFPSDGPPYLPFPTWAARAEGLRASPLGLLLHPQAGLWHAYRFALALPTLDDADRAGFARRAETPQVDLCSRCAGQPCLGACPVAAFGVGRYDVPACAGHLHGAGGGDCMGGGCLARRACPIGQDHRYLPAQAAFHMTAFRRNH